MICFKEYDPMAEPNHEEECQDRFAEIQQVAPKQIPELKKLLEQVLQKT